MPTLYLQVHESSSTSIRMSKYILRMNIIYVSKTKIGSWFFLSKYLLPLYKIIKYIIIFILQ